jgi:hypothetical protein
MHLFCELSSIIRTTKAMAGRRNAELYKRCILRDPEPFSRCVLVNWIIGIAVLE